MTALWFFSICYGVLLCRVPMFCRRITLARTTLVVLCWNSHLQMWQAEFSSNVWKFGLQRCDPLFPAELGCLHAEWKWWLKGYRSDCLLVFILWRVEQQFVRGWAFCPLLRCILMYVITQITVFLHFLSYSLHTCAWHSVCNNWLILIR